MIDYIINNINIELYVLVSFVILTTLPISAIIVAISSSIYITNTIINTHDYTSLSTNSI